MDMVLSIKMTVLKLKPTQLDVVLAATVCVPLLHLLEDLFGMPQTNTSKQEGDWLAPEAKYTDADTDTLKEKEATTTEEQSHGPSTSTSVLPPIKHCNVLEKSEKV